MAIGAFPLAKLGFVLIKQITKPIANSIAKRARASRIFRHYICLPPAQFFHWYDVKIRMRVLNLGKVSSVPKLDEKKAIETGAQLLSEGILVAVAAAIVIYEYNRSTQKEEEKQKQIEQEKTELKDRVQDLEFAVEKQSTQLKELTRLAIAIRDDLQKSLLPKSSRGGFFSKNDEKQVPNIPPVPPELMDVFEKDNLIRKDKNVGSSEIKNNINTNDNTLREVGYVYNENYSASKHLCLDWRIPHHESTKDIKSTAIVPGEITRIVEEHLKYHDYELVNV